MFKFFKKQITEVAELAETIEKIHNEFTNAGDKILADAKKIIANAEIKDEEKVQRLKKVGFRQSKQVMDNEEAIKRKKEAEENARIIEYYSMRYPMYKFITEEEVKKICEKYGLVLGDIRQYKGFVPEKNLMEIENFKVSDEDCEEQYKYVELSSLADYMLQSANRNMRSVLSSGIHSWYEEHEQQRNVRLVQGLSTDPYTPKNQEKSYKKEFKICAPEKDMNTYGYTKQGYKLIPDPVVLHTVKHGYLIVTAWGNEASDEIVINPKQN